MSTRRPLAPRRAALALLAAGTAACATAGPRPSEPISTDRPSYTNGPDVVSRPQAEGGYTVARDAGVHDYTVGELLVRIPVTSRLEARADVNSYHVTTDAGERASGYEDPGVEVKAAIGARSEHAPAIVPTLGLVAGTTLPLGSRSIGERTLQPHATLAASWDVGSKGQIQSDAGYMYASQQGTHYGQFQWSAVASVKATSRVTPYAEYYTFLPSSPGGSTGNFVDAGLTYLVTHDLQLDARVGAGGTGQEDRQRTLGVGIAQRW